jgi:hypothetical protein
MAEDQPNGNGADGKPIARLALEFDMLAGRLRIVGTVPNADVALDMLARAVRYYEGIVRLEQIAEYQRQQLDKQRTASVLANFRGRT